jgi:hypothetical protein
VDLLKTAKELGYTFAGEMFSAIDMTALARHCFGSTLQVNLFDGDWDHAFLLRLLTHLQKGGLVLVPYVLNHTATHEVNGYRDVEFADNLYIVTMPIRTPSPQPLQVEQKHIGQS